MTVKEEELNEIVNIGLAFAYGVMPFDECKENVYRKISEIVRRELDEYKKLMNNSSVRR